MLRSFSHYLKAKTLITPGSSFKFASVDINSDDPHKILGVPRNSSQDVIKNSFLKLSKKYHPDINKDPKAAEVFKKINNAYDALKGSKSSESKSSSSSSSAQSQPNTSSSSTEQDDFSDKTSREAFYEARSEDELYEMVFGRTYEQDPSFYFRKSNRHLRSLYEELLRDPRMASNFKDDQYDYTTTEAYRQSRREARRQSRRNGDAEPNEEPNQKSYNDNSNYQHHQYNNKDNFGDFEQTQTSHTSEPSDSLPFSLIVSGSAVLVLILYYLNVGRKVISQLIPSDWTTTGGSERCTRE